MVHEIHWQMQVSQILYQLIFCFEKYIIRGITIYRHPDQNITLLIYFLEHLRLKFVISPLGHMNIEQIIETEKLPAVSYLNRSIN